MVQRETDKEERKARVGDLRQRSKVERQWIILRNHQKCAEKIRSSDGGGCALQKKDKVKKELIEPASGN